MNTNQVRAAIVILRNHGEHEVADHLVQTLNELAEIESTNKKRVTAARILKRVGDPALKLYREKSGYWYFAFDVPEQNTFETESVMVSQLSDMSEDVWVNIGICFAAEARGRMESQPQ